MHYRASLQQVLADRDERVEKQQELIHKYNTTLISFNLNIPGDQKDFPLGRLGFLTGFHAIMAELELQHFPILHKEYSHNIAGSGGFIVVDGDALTIKKQMRLLEINHPLGRLFDIDVLDTNHHKISGEELGFAKRKCLICEKDAFVCSRSRAHTLPELQEKVISILKQNPEISLVFQKIADLMLKAVLYEVSATIKPGLVDRFNCGAHKDMDFFTFLDSALSLPDYFYKMTELGFQYNGTSPIELFSTLRAPGMIAEEKMFAATNGINTHKGIIFSCGLIGASYGQLLACGELITAKSLADYVARMTEQVIQSDLGSVNRENASSNGEKLFAKHGVLGIRGEAMKGFPHAIKYGLPALQTALKNGYSINDSMLFALLHIMSELDDTNVLWRHDFYTLENVRSKASHILTVCKDDPTQLHSLLRELDQEFIKKNISPGGAADLLAVTMALHFIETDELAKLEK